MTCIKVIWAVLISGVSVSWAGDSTLVYSDEGPITLYESDSMIAIKSIK